MPDVVLLHPAGLMPDTWTGVVRALPADWKPWLPNLGTGSPAQQRIVAEQYLDRQELRKVVLVGHGTGALVAAGIAKDQPHRVSHVVLSGLPRPEESHVKAAKLLPKFLLRRRGVDKGALVESLTEARNLDVAGIAAPTLLLDDADHLTDPGRFVAEIEAFLSDNPA
ncbi:alpha/beta fold hydrolase [Corynebacterium comes]|uniref:Alpha/beta hydrolase family protein n=1 Tax=Corynebacterium comes TaxID=2675218 RepID=A0A6B8VZG0_9CORY|nr:alpha/beta fold hydrolase [Corynebacterium comes]QGU05591.1 Alpha/beta hydrolase family protein [Corynebacterium comes]